MPSLDFAMPIALLIVVTVAMLLNKRVEGKLTATVEQKEFKTKRHTSPHRLMAIVISVIAYTSLISPGRYFPKYSPSSFPLILHYVAFHVLIHLLKPH